MSELMEKIEALLFSAGKKLSNDELSKMASCDAKQADEAANLLKLEYEKRASPIMIIEESDGWKMTVRERFLPLVRQINPTTELSRTVMETLAVIAWKSPVLQSTVIRIRTNKAYDHIGELEELGFIIKEKYGRSFMLKLTQKFMDYFDMKDKKDIAKMFKDIGEIEGAGQKKVDDFEIVDEIAEGAVTDAGKQS